MLSPLPSLADAVLAIGCRFTQLATGDWTLRMPENLIQIDINETEIGKNYPAKVGITADAKSALKQLLRDQCADYCTPTNLTLVNRNVAQDSILVLVG